MARALGRSLDDFISVFIGRKLFPAKEALLKACTEGVFPLLPRERPDKPEQRTQANRVRAAFMRFLMLGGDEAAPVHEQGVQLRGAWIDGSLDFEGAILPHDVALHNCWIDGKIALICARARRIDLDGSRIAELSGDGVEIKGDLFLRDGFMAEGDVKLTGAEIGGDLDCRGGIFKKTEKAALCFDRAKIDGNVFLNKTLSATEEKKFSATGEVRLVGAKIAGDLDCRGGIFRNREPSESMETNVALAFDRAMIGGGVFLSDYFRAKGLVQFVGAAIAGSLYLSKGWFVNPNGVALNFDSTKIDGDAWLTNGFWAKGEVRLEDAKIKGHFRCSNGKFQKRENAQGYAHALYFDGAEIGAVVWLDEGFSATGVVRALSHCRWACRSVTSAVTIDDDQDQL
jgi:hypothetical protein